MISLTRTETHPHVEIVRSRSLEEQFELAFAMLAFLDTSMTATNRATFYNSKEDIELTLTAHHQELLKLDRFLYVRALFVDGLTDFAKQTGIVTLLSHPNKGDEHISLGEENAAIRRLLASLSVPRMLNTFLKLRELKVNNARTRKLIVSTLLNSPNLELWSVRYRHKVRAVLTHAWGKRRFGILQGILQKPEKGRKPSEKQLIEEHLNRFVEKKENIVDIYDCLSFLHHKKAHYQLPMFQAFMMARNELGKGRTLPYEVLEGIRSVYHRNTPSKQALAFTKENLTAGQQLTLQRTAQEANVKLSVNLQKYDAVRLYVYAYETGMTDDIRLMLRRKAAQVAETLPLRFDRIGILMDNSLSMTGHRTQAMRPMAIASAIRDVLLACTDQAVVKNVSGVAQTDGLVACTGQTDLAESLLDLLEMQPDAIFILTDGYENAPQGRVADVMRMAKRIGVNVPVCQFTPVTAAEASGMRKLSPHIVAVPMSRPEAVAVGLLRTLFLSDAVKGVTALLQGSTE